MEPDALASAHDGDRAGENSAWRGHRPLFIDEASRAGMASVQVHRAETTGSVIALERSIDKADDRRGRGCRSR